MNQIKIAQKLQPFSHEKGALFLLPQTSIAIRVFPTRFFCEDLENHFEPFWVAFDWTGPVREFTAQLDLDRGFLSVFGFAKEGPLRYSIGVRQKNLQLQWEHSRPSQVASSLFPTQVLKHHEKICLVKVASRSSEGAYLERVSLGCHKAQDFSQVRRRLDPRELFPYWLQIAQGLKEGMPPQKRQGNYVLLDRALRLVEENKKEEILEALLCFFLSSFEGFFVPRLVDTEYQGLLQTKEISPNAGPLLPLLKESADCIRSLFYQENEAGQIALLPCLPAQFHCGRMLEVKTSSGAVLHFEWSKKALEAAMITASSSVELSLRLPKGICSCRLKRKKDNLKKIVVPQGGLVVLSLEENEKVTLDRFEG